MPVSTSVLRKEVPAQVNLIMEIISLLEARSQDQEVEVQKVHMELICRLAAKSVKVAALKVQIMVIT